MRIDRVLFKSINPMHLTSQRNKDNIFKNSKKFSVKFPKVLDWDWESKTWLILSGSWSTLNEYVKFDAMVKFIFYLSSQLDVVLNNVTHNLTNFRRLVRFLGEEWEIFSIMSQRLTIEKWGTARNMNSIQGFLFWWSFKFEGN